MSSFIDGVIIPEPLAKKIITESLVKVGIYDGAHHKFLAKGFQPDMSTYQKIGEEISAFGFKQEDVKEIVRNVLTDVGTDADFQLMPSLDLAGDQEIPVLSFIEFQEMNNGITNMIYLGDQKFYVLSTNRSTLMSGNIIKAKSIPLNQGAVWNFDIYENFKSKKPTVPEGYKKYQAWFNTTEVTQITMLTSCEFFKIVDAESFFGGELQDTPADASLALAEIINEVKTKIDHIEDELPTDRQFPDYITLLTKAKSLGINSYILNTIIETMERRDVVEYTSTEADWHVYKTLEQQEAEKKEIAKKNGHRYLELKKALEAELQKIHRRKVALFFDAPGVITEESKAHLKPISEEMDQLAELGFGTKGYADSEIKTALDNSKPRPKHNLKVVITIICILAIAILVAYSWLTAKKSLNIFNGKTVEMSQMLDEEKFNEAKEFILEAKSEFEPSYLRFIVARRVSQSQNTIEIAIDEFVASRIEQVQTMMKANRGRIDEYTWGLIVEAMEFRPDDVTLNELREKYIAQ